MKDDNRSLPQRLTSLLAGSTRRLLQASRDTPKPATWTPATDSMPGLPDEACRHRPSFSGEMFAELLLELPGFQKEISQAHQSGDRHSLGRHLHRLLGAVAYCDAPELEAALRKLQQAIKTEGPGSQDNIDTCYTLACSAISSTLHNSGYRGD